MADVLGKISSGSKWAKRGETLMVGMGRAGMNRFGKAKTLRDVRGPLEGDLRRYAMRRGIRRTAAGGAFGALQIQAGRRDYTGKGVTGQVGSSSGVSGLQGHSSGGGYSRY